MGKSSTPPAQHKQRPSIAGFDSLNNLIKFNKLKELFLHPSEPTSFTRRTFNSREGFSASLSPHQPLFRLLPTISCIFSHQAESLCI